MKTVRKLAAIVLVGAMALSIAACKKSAKKVSADEFVSACNEAGLIIENLGGGKGIKEAWGGQSSDGSLEANYVIVEDKSAAKEEFKMYTDMEDTFKAMGADVKMSSNRMEMSMNDNYMLAVLADDMMISISSQGAESTEAAKKIVEKLGI